MKPPSGDLRRILQSTLLLLAILAVLCPLCYYTIDLDVALYAHYGLPTPLVAAAKATSDIDDVIVAAFVVAALLARARADENRFRKLALPPLAALAAGIPTHLLKPLFGRWRPSGYFHFGEYGFEFFAPYKSALTSFPSGHAMNIAAIMTAIALLNVKHCRSVCFVVAALLGACRVIVGAHYPSDVLAGLAFGYLSTHWLRLLLMRKNWLPDTVTRFQNAAVAAK